MHSAQKLFTENNLLDYRATCGPVSLRPDFAPIKKQTNIYHRNMINRNIYLSTNLKKIELHSKETIAFQK